MQDIRWRFFEIDSVGNAKCALLVLLGVKCKGVMESEGENHGCIFTKGKELKGTLNGGGGGLQKTTSQLL